jgi:hypothetical protein
MSIKEGVWMLFDMMKTTIQSRLNIFFEKNNKGKAISQQAFSELRDKFDHTIFSSLHVKLTKEEYSGKYNTGTWKNYHLFAIDGAEVQLPRTAKLRLEFGTRGRGDICPCAGISIMYDVMNEWVVDANITRSSMNERTESIEHVEKLCSEFPYLVDKSIILQDAGYPSKEIFARYQALGVKFIFKYPSDRLTEINNAPMGDTIIELDNGQKLRIIKYEGRIEKGEKKKTTITLVTNLFDFSVYDMKILYKKRWGVETFYNKLKNKLRIEEFSGKTKNSIYQDFWASICLANITQTFEKGATQIVQEERKGKFNKYEYKVRETAIVIEMRNKFIFYSLFAPSRVKKKLIRDVIMDAVRSTTPIRPNREYERNFKPNYKAKHNLKSHL